MSSVYKNGSNLEQKFNSCDPTAAVSFEDPLVLAMEQSIPWSSTNTRVLCALGTFGNTTGALFDRES